MLIKFFGGKGSGGGISSYLVDPNRPGREGAPPEVVSGDIARTCELINSIDRKWSYSTGVISFALEDAPTVAQQKALMVDFERVAFAGLSKERVDITWVRHSHTEGGRVELHFLVPRLDLATGKDFNIAPPGWERSFAPLRDAYNYEHGWARPDDPARARTLQPVAESEPRLQGREAITAFLEQKIVASEVTNRAELITALNTAGFETPRVGKSYVTALDPNTGERWRMKGRIYEKDWTRDAELDRAVARDNPSPAERAGGPDAERATEARQQLEAVINRRAEWNRARYPEPADRDAQERLSPEEVDQGRPDRDPREAEAMDPDQRRDSHPDHEPDRGRADALDDVAAASRDGRAERDRDIPDPATNGSNGLALWRSALRKIGGLNEREPDSDRTGAFGRIRELGSRIRNLGASAVAAVQTFFGRDDGIVGQTEQARGAFEASERGLGATERLNDRLDQQSNAFEQRIEMKEQLADLEREFDRQKTHQLTR